MSDFLKRSAVLGNYPAGSRLVAQISSPEAVTMVRSFAAQWSPARQEALDAAAKVDELTKQGEALFAEAGFQAEGDTLDALEATVVGPFDDQIATLAAQIEELERQRAAKVKEVVQPLRDELDAKMMLLGEPLATQIKAIQDAVQAKRARFFEELDLLFSSLRPWHGIGDAERGDRDLRIDLSLVEEGVVSLVEVPQEPRDLGTVIAQALAAKIKVDTGQDVEVRVGQMDVVNRGCGDPECEACNPRQEPGIFAAPTSRTTH